MIRDGQPCSNPFDIHAWISQPPIVVSPQVSLKQALLQFQHITEATIPGCLNDEECTRIKLGKYLIIQQDQDIRGCLSEQVLLRWVTNAGSLDERLQTFLPMSTAIIDENDLLKHELIRDSFRSPDCDNLVIFDAQHQLVGVLGKDCFLQYWSLTRAGQGRYAQTITPTQSHTFPLSNQTIHELRSPLNVLMGKIESMKEELFGPISRDQYHALHTMEQASMRLLNALDIAFKNHTMPHSALVDSPSIRSFSPNPTTPTDIERNSVFLHASEGKHDSPLILLADDSEANLSTFTSYLRAKGYRVLQARTGQEAVDITKTDDPDVILMDIQMPTLSGYEAISLIRQDPRYITLPIIAITGRIDDKESCLSAGATVYLTKPVKLSTLTTTIHQLMERQFDEAALN